MNTSADDQSSPLRGALRGFLEKPRTQHLIMALIIVNTIILGLETVPEAMAAYGPLLLAVDKVILGIFVVEILLRIFVYRLAFFRDPWSLFDFTVVVAGEIVFPLTLVIVVVKEYATTEVVCNRAARFTDVPDAV